ncbi:hypothetical protein K2O51_30880 (plasmid) [Cupriavidus pinatubonensis]|uniref:hypothetical protein n=1 Tax=Cupriavidus pinatubonensis TaxID=248026 RepID=UPI001C7338A0|nr:hypothetical protein [Cupriavidus pinatubonensis]QYY33654.1 hypothetical protein K2O51_30880 [Cupriavidus pinatubonensis]
MTTECELELHQACLELARAILWTASGPSADVVETLACKIVGQCGPHLGYIQTHGADPFIVSRAVRYLANVHAIPVRGTDMRWISEMLECLIELAVPNSTVTDPQFLHDLQAGIAQSL